MPHTIIYTKKLHIKMLFTHFSMM